MGARMPPKFPRTTPVACQFITNTGGTIRVKPGKAAYFSDCLPETWDIPDYQKDVVNAFYRTQPNL